MEMYSVDTGGDGRSGAQRGESTISVIAAHFGATKVVVAVLAVSVTF